MQQLLQLLIDLKKISFEDISEVPAAYRHDVLIHIEELQDHLKHLISED